MQASPWIPRAPAVGVLSFLLLLLAARSATAADIATVLGTPGDATWNAACGVTASVPNGPLGLIECGPIAEPACLHRVDIDTSPGAFPHARCSDGTPAVFYVREGTEPDKWMIHLEGGGGCMTEEECRVRWCGEEFYDASLMSSDWDADGVPDMPDHVTTFGIASAIPANQFSTWTQVYVPYCSSDGWLGRESDVDLGGVSSFEVDARGHTIVRAVRNMLREVNPTWTTVGSYPVPNLDDATEIVFTGTSAGGLGAVQNADWFLSPFTARVGLVVDGALTAGDVALHNHDVWIDTSGDGTGDERYLSYRMDLEDDRWLPGGYWNDIDAFVDETCRASYESSGHLNRCILTSTLLLFNSSGQPMVSTPTFARVDLEDPVLSASFTDDPNDPDDEFVLMGRWGSAATIDDYASIMRETLVELYADFDSVTGAYGPRCGDHVGLSLLLPFGVVTTPDTDDGTLDTLNDDSTFHDALWDWFGSDVGAFQPYRRVDSDTAIFFSDC